MFGEKNIIEQSGDNNVALQNSNVYITVSIFDEIETLSKQGRYNEVADLLSRVKNFVGTQHPLYPHYRYKPVNFGNTTILEHEPLSAEAQQKYPLSYRGKFTIPKEKIEGFKNIHELIEEAYFKQEDIEINMDSLTTWLGDYMVDTPNLDELFKDGKWVITPRPLPEPLKLKLYIKDEQDISIVDYLEMSISGGKANQYVIIDNSKQESAKMLVSLRIPLNSKVQETKINIKIKHEYQSNVEANRSLLSFFKLVKDGNKTIVLKNLQENKDFMVASKFKFDGNIQNLDKDYSFVEKLFRLENHYKVIFSIPEKMEKSDWESIEILEQSMQGKPLKRTLKNFIAEFNDKKTIENLIDLFKDQKEYRIRIETTGPEARIELFGAVIPIEKVQTVFNSLKIEDIERLKGKMKFMDEGENIKIIFVPGEDPEYNEYFFFKD